MLSRITSHVRRMLHHAGMPIRIGAAAYRMQGYFGNRLAPRAIWDEAHLKPALTHALAHRVGLFIDVGANLGQTLFKVLELDPSRRYVGFEPQVGCCFFIEQFLARNGLDRCRVLPVALARETGLVRFYARNPFDDMASMWRDHLDRGIARETVVPTRRGDDILDELDVERPGIVKIDVEGAELDVLQGLAGCIEAARPAIFFELLPNFVGAKRTFLPETICDRQRKAAREIRSFLTGLGYSLWQIDGTGRTHAIEHFDLDTPESFVGRDYMAWPAEVAGNPGEIGR